MRPLRARRRGMIAPDPVRAGSGERGAGARVEDTASREQIGQAAVGTGRSVMLRERGRGPTGAIRAWGRSNLRGTGPKREVERGESAPAVDFKLIRGSTDRSAGPPGPPVHPMSEPANEAPFAASATPGSGLRSSLRLRGEQGGVPGSFVRPVERRAHRCPERRPGGDARPSPAIRAAIDTRRSLVYRSRPPCRGTSIFDARHASPRG